MSKLVLRLLEKESLVRRPNKSSREASKVADTGALCRACKLKGNAAARLKTELRPRNVRLEIAIKFSP